MSPVPCHGPSVRKVSHSVRPTNQCQGVRPAAKEKKLLPSDPSRTLSLSEGIPSQMEPELFLLPRWPVLPPIRQRKPKQDERQKATQECTCCLADCSYHNKDTQSSPADQSSRSVSTSAGPAAKEDSGLQKLKEEPGLFEINFPYRPKRGCIVDPELEPKKASAEHESLTSVS